MKSRIQIKPLKSDDTETMYELKNKSSFTGFKPHGNIGCLAFKNQTVTFKKLTVFRFLGTKNLLY